MPKSDRNAATVTIVLCALAALCEGIDLQAAGVAAGGIRPEYHPTDAQLGNFFSASTLGLFIGALIGGRLADNIGRRSILIASIVLFGLFSLLTPLSWDMTSLTLARLLTGFGLGGALPNVVALIAESSRPGRRSANVTLGYAAMPFGGALASLLVLLTGVSHWRWVFVLGGVVPLLIAPIMMRALPESSAFLQAKSSVGAAPAAAGTALRGFSAIMAEGRAGRTLLLWLAFFLLLLILYLLLNWLPTLLVGDGLGQSAAAGAQIGFNVGGALAAWLIGPLLEGRRRSASLVVTYVGLPVLVYVLAVTPPVAATIILVVFLLGCAVLAAQAYLYAVAPACYPTIIRGSGVGAAIAIGRIGSIVGPKLGGWLKGMGHNSSQLLIDLLPAVIVGSASALVLAWLLARDRGGVAEVATER
jgi:AAHS family 3-hydroxyphenylpropionic acid transporter